MLVKRNPGTWRGKTNPKELISKLGPLNRSFNNLEVHLVSETFYSAALSSPNL